MSHTHHPVIRSVRATRPLLRIVLAVLLPAMFACGESGDRNAAIDRDVFIQAYVELRTAALNTDSQRVADADRDSILTSLNLTAVDLIDFAAAWGSDVEFMRDLWNEVEARLDVMPSEN